MPAMPRNLLAGRSYVAAVVGCSPPNTYDPPPPPAVTVARPVKKTVTNYLEETGTTEAVQKVEIRARVKGFLESVAFEPGAIVEKGDLLFEIEPDLYKARVEAAEAEVGVQQGRLRKAQIEKDRPEKMRKQDPGATSEVAVVAAQAEFEASQAAVKTAEADLRQTQIDLGYTIITAPIPGRVGKTLVKQGNLVGDNQATHLTTVIQYDPIYANFNISERALLELRGTNPRQGDDEIDKESILMYLKREIDEGFPSKGHFDYADLAVDQSTGTFMVRGIFENPDYLILPGLFVQIRIPVDTQEDALLVPERALGADQAGRYVLVVNTEKGNEVERRNVVPGAKFGNLVVINQGLQETDLVIVDGIQRARPGSPVTPERIELSAEVETVKIVKGDNPSPASDSPAADNPAELDNNDDQHAGHQ